MATAAPRCAAGQPAPGHGDGFGMHAQLSGDRSDAPLFDMVIAQDPRLEFSWNGHDRVLFVGFGGPGVAGSLGAHGLNSDGHNAGSTIAARAQAAGCPTAIVARPPPPDPWPAQHPIDAGVNRDASLYFAAPDSGAIAPRVSFGHDGSPGSAAPPHAATAGARAARTRRSRYDPDRNGCR